VILLIKEKLLLLLYKNKVKTKKENLLEKFKHLLLLKGLVDLVTKEMEQLKKFLKDQKDKLM
jgi:hypothetical protein